MGNNTIYNQIVSQRGSFENLVAKIPGFRGYHEKNARREADRLLRDYLANEIERLVKRFNRIENKMLDAGGMKHMTRTREIKAKLQAYTERVQTANPGYSAMFAEIKIGNDELDRIYAFDEAQMQYVLKLEKALDALEDEVKKGDGFADALDAVEEAANEANDAFELRDDEILKLSEQL
jgi:hypothetical protein